MPENGGSFQEFALSREMPYRIDVDCSPPNAVDVLMQLGALDIEPVNEGLAAILPDSVAQEGVANALGVASVTISDVVARDRRICLSASGDRAVRCTLLSILSAHGGNI